MNLLNGAFSRGSCGWCCRDAFHSRGSEAEVSAATGEEYFTTARCDAKLRSLSRCEGSSSQGKLCKIDSWAGDRLGLEAHTNYIERSDYREGLVVSAMK